MDREPGRLVDDEQEGVAVEEARHYLVGTHPDGAGNASPARQGHRMALQGRKPGWLLDKILGREEAPDAAGPKAATEPAPELPALSPASLSEGQPDFMPAADAPPTRAPPGVTEASPETAPAAKPVDALEGASLQPVADRADTPVPAAGASAEGAAILPLRHAEERPAGGSRSTHDRVASPDWAGGRLSEAPAAQAPRDAELGRVGPSPQELGIAPSGASPEPAAGTAAEPGGWWRRLSSGMRRTSSAIGESVTGLFTKKRLARAPLDDLEDVLIGADLGVETATRITKAVAGGRYDREISADEVRSIMAGEIEAVLAPVATPLAVDAAKRPFVILMVGVNGAGKTTTIGKLAEKFRRQGLSVVIAAGDTFRAAAIEQLKVWGDRVGAPVISRGQGADAAGLAFDALGEARTRGADVLLVDTAGRLQNKAGLMEELSKIIRVIRKLDPEAPHASLLVLDATVGQNALSQVELFGKVAGVTGLVMTKLDGTARGGILVALAARFGLPVHFIGVGEGVDDLEPFAARDFARAIAGLDEAA